MKEGVAFPSTEAVTEMQLMKSKEEASNGYV